MEEILVPLLNANEPEARIVKIRLKDLTYVKPGDLLMTIETTKATSEIEASSEGFFQLAVKEGAIVEVGSVLGWIKQDRNESVGSNEKEEIDNSSIRITDPARTLLKDLRINIDDLPGNKLITTDVVKQYAEKHKQTIHAIPINENMDPEKAIIVFGGGGHSKAIMELIQAIGTYNIIGILDDNIPIKTEILGIKVIGTRQYLGELRSKGIKFAANAVGGIIDTRIRIKICNLLEDAGFDLPTLIHPRATVEGSAYVERGVQVFPNSYIGSNATIGKHSIINTNAVVSHDCTINSYSHLSPGSLISGHVHIGNNCLIGMGVTTTIGISIGNESRIGNGAILSADVPANSIIQSGSIWKG